MRFNSITRLRVYLALLCATLLIAGGLVKTPVTHADTTPQTPPVVQNWGTGGVITTTNDWSGVPGFIAYRGDDFAAGAGGTGRDPQTVTQDLSTTPVSGTANVTNANANTTGAVAEIEDNDSNVGTPFDVTVAFQGSGTADAPNLVVTLNTTGRTNINVAYNVRDVDGSADNAITPVALQYRVGTTGNYINLSAGFVADATTGGTATQVTPVSVTLPYLADNQPVVQVRMITTDAVGSDEWVGIDDINITGTTTQTFVRPNKISDFDGDGKADISVWRPTERNWYILQSSDSTLRTVIDWGGSELGDRAVPGDYDGDGKTDVAVWRPQEGNWYIIQSSTNTPTIVYWGGTGDTPVPADYDGDFKTDVAVWRAAEGNWYIKQSTNGAMRIQQWGGAASDVPVPADYDGDAKADCAVYRAAEGNWYVRNSSIVTQTGITAAGGTGSLSIRQWGVTTDKPLPRDYDADGKADFAVFRAAEGNWYIRNSSNGAVIVQNWGTGEDILVPADYNGDNRADIGVFRGSEGNWYILASGGVPTPVILVNLGLSGDVPVPAAYPPSQQP